MTRRGKRARLFAAGAVVWGAWIAPALGHGLDPAFLALRGTGQGKFEVTWRTASLRLPGADVQPVLPAHCRQVGTSTSAITLEHVTLRWSIDCGTAGLAGATVSVRDLDAARINTLLRIEEPGRPPMQVVLNPRRAGFTVPRQATWRETLYSYSQLGVEHMLTGADHLFFVFGLLLLLPSTGLLIKTMTAFALGHSIPLSLAALDLATAPSRPFEVLIALSVLALAVELSRDAADGTMMRRSPWILAAGFGLLQGCAFAGTLTETGLATADVPAALLAFNAGIEIGQLLFIAVVLIIRAAARRWLPGLANRAQATAAYAMGILAVFWCLDRAVAWLG